MSLLKTSSILLVLLALGFATAPSWIATGANLNYSQGGNTITFTVTGRTDTDILIQLTTSTPLTKSIIPENASLDSGHFWFDPTLLANAYQGEVFDGLTVMGTSQQTFAGQSWTAVTLQGTLSGVQTTEMYDQQTGILLKLTVAGGVAPDVVLTQYYVPALAPPPPPPQQNNTTTTPPPAQNSTNSTATAPPPSNSSAAPNTTETTQPPPETSTPPANQTSSSPPSSKSKSLCCPSSFILLLVGFVALRGKII